MVHFVCGIGASAGGLKAVESLLPGLPGGKKIAYVFLQHSAPHDSDLAAILGRLSSLPVRTVEDGLRPEGGVFYLCPPARRCQIRDGCFRLDSNPQSGARHSIDFLFASIADQYPEHCAGIILSGTGNDGVAGVQEIKAAGGWVLVQEPASAVCAGMPQQVLDHYLADFVQPAAALGSELAGILSLGKKKSGKVSVNDHEELLALVELLENRSGFNFNRYKEAMLFRRIKRRMQVNKLDSLDQYAKLVQRSDSEVQCLLKDLFINVTGFFRDVKVFERLKSLLRQLVESASGDSPLRIWSAGCATGEEAYSIALLLKELEKELSREIDFRIIATDIDGNSINFARRGLYSALSIEKIPRRLVQVYFNVVDGGYQVGRELRETVVFAEHDLIRDVAFSRIDLICCRNVFIYFNRATQARLLSRLHYALNKDGYLLLGASENTGSDESLFKAIDRQYTLYQRREVRNLPQAPVFRTSGQARPGKQAMAKAPWREEAWEIYFNEYAPAAVLLNARLELLHVHGQTSAYLELPDGNFNIDILHLAKPELKTDLQLLLHQAQSGSKSARSRAIRLPHGSRRAGPVMVTMVTINAGTDSDAQAGSGDILLIFEESPLPRMAASRAGKMSDEDKNEHIKALEEELAVTREQLQANIEALNASNQKLQSVSEEFHSTMEELESSNEEYQTSNEELESINEELITVNDELNAKSQDLSRVNNELDAILNTAFSGIILLDSDMQVTRYSESCRQLFKLWPKGVNNVHQLMLRLDGLAQMSTRIREVMETGREGRLELQLDEKYFVVRLLPIFNAVEAGVSSLVLAFFDETERQRHQRESELLAAIVRSSDDAILVQDLKGNISNWNDAAQAMFGYTREDALSLNVRDLIARGQKKRFSHYIDELVDGGSEHGLEISGLTREGKPIDVWSSASVLKGADGKPVSVAVIFRDIGEKNAVEANLVALVESTPDPLLVVDEAGTILRVNRQVEKLLGYDRSELLGHSFKMLVPQAYRDSHDSLHLQYLKAPVMRKMGRPGLDLYCLTKSGESIAVDISLSPVERGSELTILVRIRDIRQEKAEHSKLEKTVSNLDEANIAKTRFLAAASHDLRQPLQSINMYLGALNADISEKDKKHALKKVRLAVDTTSNLLNSLLDISKLESGTVEPQTEAFAIGRLLQRVYNTEAPLAQEKHQKFTLIPCSVRVHSDPALLEQLITNLVGNALKYSPAGRHIVLGCRRHKSHLRIQVVDNGPGIDRSQLDSIFEEYRQLDDSGGYPGKGLGLGLSIVKLIAELLNLQLEVNSIKGAGSVFSVIVPMAKRQRPAKKYRQVHASGKGMSGATLLLVEDDNAVLDSTRLFLEMSGYKVVSARNSKQAMAALKKHRIDILVSDYGLAEQSSGIDLVKAIRKQLKKVIPAVVITGDTSGLRSREAAKAGCELIAKPIKSEMLLEVLQRLQSE